MRVQGATQTVLLLLLIGLASGCGFFRDPDAEAMPPAAPSPSAPEVAVLPPPPAPEPKPPRPRPAPALDPQKLVGLDKDEAMALIGEPTAVREQSPSTVWNYRLPECTLELFFYMDVSTSAFRVLSYDLKMNGRTAESRRVCLTRLRAASREP